MKITYLFLTILLPLTSWSQQVDLVTPLQDSLKETSGLILLNDRLITHNDSGGEPALYEIDSVSGGILRKVIIENASNIDWEDICYDDTYIYIADFGNNNGNRTNLRVYRMLISDYFTTTNDTISADTIQFEYADQIDFTSTTFSTNFDAEAMISWNDSLYIFTKNWGNQWTNIYALPKTPGNYSIPRIDSINTNGFVTGASFNASSNSIILSGYAFTYPFIVEISNFTNSQFSSFTVNRTQIQFPASYSYQLEGITPINATNFYISTEESFSGASGLFRLKLDPTNAIDDINGQSGYSIYPIPTSHYLNIDSEEEILIDLYTLSGKLIRSTSNHQIDVSNISKGTYLVVLKDKLNRTITSERVIIE